MAAIDLMLYAEMLNEMPSLDYSDNWRLRRGKLAAQWRLLSKRDMWVIQGVYNIEPRVWRETWDNPEWRDHQAIEVLAEVALWQ
jgi:hypothetical protein